MAVTTASFLARFPEFARAPRGLIEGAIADAIVQIDRCVFRDKADAATQFLAAHMVANNPLGEVARLEKKGADGEPMTTYLYEFNRLKRIVTSGFRVT